MEEDAVAAGLLFSLTTDASLVLVVVRTLERLPPLAFDVMPLPTLN
jgi:hypothetical protein